MRLDDGRVIPNFMKQALTGKDLTVYGDGKQTRSFCYVDDMIEGLVALLESDVQKPVNIGNPDERTINELAEVVLEVTGSESGITHGDLPPQDPQVRRPDISKARLELGWEPDVGLREGLQESMEYFNLRV
jgi:dTDP-glucose 4,6-dehydratase